MSFKSRDTKGIRVVKVISLVVAAIALLLVVIAIALYLAVRASLPTLDGTKFIDSVTAPIKVTRDAQGTVAIEATTKLDAMRALGFIHAQERFFEMDLARRAAAGELSALLGKATVKMDEAKRIHRFRARLGDTVLRLRYSEQQTLQAYADGVNAGLNNMSVRPWQYLALRADPQAWAPVDSLLVIAEMYSMLQGRTMETAFSDALLREQLNEKLFDWLKPRGGSWDATLDGSVIPTAPIPGPALIDTRAAKPAAPATTAPAPAANVSAISIAYADVPLLGSNAWAVTGALTKHGGAMIANDMHLGLTVPNIWFRAQLQFIENGAPRRLVGVTLPGVPALVAGSNGDIAWGFTNAYGKWLDWVPAKGLAAVEFTEVIAVKGGASVTLKGRETSVGPIAKTHDGRDFALAWMAHRPGGINLRMSAVAAATDVASALDIAHGAGTPHQNFFVVDKQGNAAWTIAGLMHERTKTGGAALGFAQVSEVAYEVLAADKYPTIKNPANGRLWSGNNRKLGGASGASIGEGGGDLGARAQQIRDRLREKQKFSEAELISIQYDNESRFLARWREQLRFSAAEAGKPGSADLLDALKKWNGRADVDQVGHRLVRAFRARVHDQLWKAWMTTLAPTLGKAAIVDGRFEYPVWQAITERPMHLLPQPFASWDEFLSAQVAFVRDDLIKTEGNIANATWGNRNKAAIKHPFSRIIPALAPYLDMPPTPLAGDNHMPAVALSSFGASQHMVIAPGREAEGILTMPGGQSGHPLSPFYGAGHKDWLEHKPAPLLAGPATHTLTLRPPRY